MWHLLGKNRKHCFSFSIECARAPDHITLCATPNSQPLEHGQHSYSSNTGQCRQKTICLAWNNYLTVHFLTVLLNTPVPMVLIIPAWWTKDTRQDLAHIETWQKSSMAHPTTMKSHTNLKLHVCMCRGLHFLFILSLKSYFSFMSSDSTTVPRFHTCKFL